MATFRRFAVSLAALTLAVGGLAGCPTAPQSSTGRANLTTDVDATLQKMYNRDDSLKGFLDKAAGYAVFPSIGKAGFVVGGAYGKGEVYEQGKKVGYCDLSQASAGLQIGAQTYSEVVVFESDKQLHDFQGGNYALTAQVSAVALKPGVARTAKFQSGVAVFTHTNGGLMAEAVVAGQKFRFRTLEQGELSESKESMSGPTTRP